MAVLICPELLRQVRVVGVDLAECQPDLHHQQPRPTIPIVIWRTTSTARGWLLGKAERWSWGKHQLTEA